MDAVLGALEAMNDAAYWTYRDADVLRVARSEGPRLRAQRILHRII